jgi:hypothetical protein
MFSTLSEHTHTHFHAYTYKHPDCWHASVGSSHTCSSACRALPDERLQSPVRCLTPCSVAQIGVTSCWWYLYSPILRYDAYIHIHIDIDIHTAPICIVYMIILLLKHNSFFNTQQVDMNNWIICLLYTYIYMYCAGSHWYAMRLYYVLHFWYIVTYWYMHTITATYWCCLSHLLSRDEHQQQRAQKPPDAGKIRRLLGEGVLFATPEALNSEDDDFEQL